MASRTPCPTRTFAGDATISLLTPRVLAATSSASVRVQRSPVVVTPDAVPPIGSSVTVPPIGPTIARSRERP